MSRTRRIGKQPVRFTLSCLVLVGAATAIGACSSGEASSDDPIARARMNLGWEGGCACMPVSSCPTVTTGCIYASLTTCGRGICLAGQSYCYVAPDKTICSTSGGLKGSCDGGYCGTCPGCYLKNGLCNAGTTVGACKVEGELYCQSCDDGNECTSDNCTGGKGCHHTAVPDKTACAGGGGICIAGKCCTGCYGSSGCQSGVTVEACGAPGTECRACSTPSNPCLRATCVGGACGTEPVPAGNSCSDGDSCNGDEACDGAGNCVKGTPLDCTSSDPCQIGKCDSAKGCIFTPNEGGRCSDGDACTSNDLCDANGNCVAGTRKSCNDGKDCTSDSCDPATGNCLNPQVPDDSPCDDGAACTQGELCKSGVCVAGTISCDDGKYCTKDIVVCPAGTCSFDPAPMVGQACVPTDKCLNGTCDATGSCVGGTPVNCDDGNPCTKDSCDPAQGCRHENEPATTVCGDGNPCTTDDRCRPLTGKCAGTPIACAALDDCHSPGTCDPNTGRCDDPRRADGFPCANRTGNCASGVCKINEAGGAAGMAGAAGAAGIVSHAGTAGMSNLAGSAGVGNASNNGGAAGAFDGFGGSSVGGANVGGAIDDNDLYKRNPGGCSCNLPSQSSYRSTAGLALLGAILGRLRRRISRNDRHRT